MKKYTLNILMSATLILLWSCGPKKAEDSKAVAEDQNEVKFENTNLEDDTDFAVKAADGGMLEVQLGQLAQTNASSTEIKKFGQMMVDDHTKANEELKRIAQQKNITIPATLSEKMRKEYDNLTEKKGAEFDKDYIDLMVSDHKKDIDAFEKEADKGKDADLKSWASSKLPTLKHHLETAQKTQDAIKKNL